MAAEHVEWMPAVLVLLAGLIVGIVVVLQLIRSGAAGARTGATGTRTDTLERRDLLARRDDLVQQLRELEDTSSKRSPEQLTAERTALEVEAARVLRRLDLTQTVPARGGARGKAAQTARARTGGSAAASAGAAADNAASAPIAGPASQMRGFLWGVGSMAAIGLLLFFVWRAATERGQSGTLTGNLPMSDRPGSAAAEADPLQPLKDAVARNPEDLDARMELVRAALGQRDLMEVHNQAQYVLERQPNHPAALAYEGLVQMAMGETDAAIETLKKSLKGDPDQIEAYLHLSMVYVRAGRLPEATRTMDEAVKRHPKEASQLKALFAEMKKQPAPGSEAAEEAANVPESGAAAPAESSAARPGGPEKSVAGSLDIDPGAKAGVSAGSIIFLTLRPDGGAPGPPYAAKRLAAGSFPLAFRIGSADSMMGQELPARVRVEARVDSDGDPLTRNPADPAVVKDGVPLGSTNLKLLLHR